MAQLAQMKAMAWAAAILLTTLHVASLVPVFASNTTKVKGGYYSAGSSHLIPSSVINATLFTHLMYAFASVDSLNSTLQIGANSNVELTSFSASMKKVNPDVFTLISVQPASSTFMTLLLSHESRAAFINSSIAFARSYQLDGIDLDWEFPQSQENMTNFGTLLSEWRQAVIAEAQQSSRAALILTAAVYFTSTILYNGAGTYPITSISANLDFINIMCYDFHGSWNVAATGANSNLYDPKSVLSADHGIKSWLEAGLPPDKAVLGLTLYGRSWQLANQNANAGLGAPAVAAGPPQPLSNDAGVFLYSEIVDFISNNNATVVHDEQEVTAYCYANNTWVSYEDPVIVTAKVLYANSKDLRGYFFWAVSFDKNWEVSTAASRTLDYAIPVGPPQAPAPAPSVSSAIPTTAKWPVSATVALLISILLLLFSGSYVRTAG